MELWRLRLVGVSLVAVGLVFVVPASAQRPTLANVQTRVTTAPTVTSFDPTSGGLGTTVTLKGTGFSGVSRVTFGGVPAVQFSAASDTKLTATISNFGRSGHIRVTTSHGSVTTAGIFTLTPPPTIGSFLPTAAAVGNKITITGTHFTGASVVNINNTPVASFVVESASKISARVGAGTTSGLIVVAAPGGTAVSSGPFTVTGVPMPEAFEPSAGSVGWTVTITGRQFDGTTAVSFGGKAAASFTLVSDTEITATVATGTTTGHVSVRNAHGIGTTSGQYTVIPPPTITGFTPQVGGDSTQVEIAGTNFSGDGWSAYIVEFDGENTSFAVVTPNEILASAPHDVRTGRITVTTPYGAATSAGKFTVEGPPTITSFTPKSGSVGASVKIKGTNLLGASSVEFNGTHAATFTVNSSTQITATVASGTTSGPITITTPSGFAGSSTAFTVH